MKQRTNGRSPDRADAFFGCIEIARRRHGLTSLVRAARKTAMPSAPVSQNAKRLTALEAATTARKGGAKFSDLIQQSVSSNSGWAGQNFR
jgi:hypothetical protein